MDNSHQELKSKMILMEHEINKLHVKLDLILEILSHTKQSCDKMDNHIDFINSTYSSLKAPLDYISDSFNSTKKFLG